MRKRLGVCALLLLLPTIAFAQNDDPDWYLDEPIYDIVFDGLEFISESELDGIVEPFIGQRFTESRFQNLQRRLYALDYFEEIIPMAERGGPDDDQLVLRFEVVERAVVSQIRFEGNRSVRRRHLEDVILLSEGDVVTDSRLRSARNAIASEYEERGYPDTEVSSRVEEDDDGRQTVVFEISEGFRTVIREIEFSGNSFASASTLRGVMESRPQSLFNRGIFQEGLLEQDRRQIEQYYRERGYIDARVVDIITEIERDEEDERNYVTLSVFVEEGQRWTYGGMEFQGNTLFSDEQLSDRLRLTPGNVLNQQRLEADFQRVADLYFENGYIFNEISRDEIRDEEEQTISYRVNIVERDRARIENIVIRGNEKTRDHVVRREIPLEEGEVFNAARVRQGMQNLANTQYFSNVVPETPQGSAEGLMDLIVNVEEGNTADIRLGVAFGGSADFPVSAQVRWQDINFLGRGQTVGAEINASPVSQRFSANFQERYLFGRRWSGGLSASVERSVRSNVRQLSDETDDAPAPYSSEDEYDDAGGTFRAPIPDQYLMDYTAWNVSFGGNTGYRWSTRAGRLSARTSLRTSAEYIDYDRDIYTPFNEATRENWQRWRFVNRWGVGTQLDSRDLVISPSTGFNLSQDVTFAGGVFRGSQHFIKTESKAERFFTLFDIQVFENWAWKWVLGGQTKLDLIYDWPEGLIPSEYRDRPERWISDSNLLFLDGMFNARGWTGRRGDRGRALWNNWLELRMPLAEQIIWLDGFIEGATLQEEPGDILDVDAEDFLFSTGFGLRFTIPQFPIRLYLARRFTVDDGDVQWEESTGPFGFDFVFSIGTELF